MKDMKDIWDYLPSVWKAVIGFITPAAVVLVSSVIDGSAGGSAITAGEWITAACAAVITAGGVYQVPNKDLDHTPPKL